MLSFSIQGFISSLGTLSHFGRANPIILQFVGQFLLLPSPFPVLVPQMISMLLPATALRSLELIECTPARTSSTSWQPGIHGNLWLQGLAVMLIWLVTAYTALWAANSSILDSLMIKWLIVIPAPVQSPTSGSTTLNRQLSLRSCCHCPPPSERVKKGPSLQLQSPEAPGK